MCYIGTYLIGPQRHGSRQNNRRTYYVSPYASDNWNYVAGQKIRVVCYTNAPSARLLLNGQPIGGEAKRDADSNILYWDIAYQPGTLRCEAENGAFYEIEATKAPYALRLTTDSLCHVFVDIIDEDGRLVKTADNEVTLHIRGARLLGMENGNIMDTAVAGRQLRNRLRAHGGRIVAYIQLPKEDNVPSQKANEEVSIHASSPFLQSAEVSF